MPYQLRKDKWPRAIFEIPRAKHVCHLHESPYG